ncbi:MAG: hypothetical protein QW455_07975 [Archaeoglobaceae archaeon]
MTYEVYLHPEVVKFLKKLPKEDVERIKAKLYELKNPHFVKSVKIKGGKAFRVRVGITGLFILLMKTEKSSWSLK